MIYIVCPINDVLMKLLGDRLHYVEISFFRFLFSSLTLAVPVVFSNKNVMKTHMHGMHFARGAMGCLAIALCCWGVNVMPLAENTTILFSEALFTLPLAMFFLHEKVHTRNWIATIIGFAGLVVMFRPSLSNFNSYAIIPTIAAFLFAVMDIMIKGMVDRKENNLTMLVYFALYTTLISAVFVPFFWLKPTLYEVFLFFLLGIGSNLIQVCMFLAYKSCSASTLAPLRYTELPFAILFGFALFGQIPDIVTIVGGALIVGGTMFNTYSER